MKFKTQNAKCKDAKCKRCALAACVVAATCLATVACSDAASAGAAPTSEVKGVYANAEGNASVEFLSPRPGSGQATGKAHFSLHGVGGQCTYTYQDRRVLLTCEGETTEFTLEDDGALTGPPDSFLTRLKKKA